MWRKFSNSRGEVSSRPYLHCHRIIKKEKEIPGSKEVPEIGVSTLTGDRLSAKYECELGLTGEVLWNK